MKTSAFSSRVAKEIIRDPLSLIFGLCFPVVLLLLLSAINANVPVNVFDIEMLTPGIAVFGYSFLTLFSAQLVSGDRCSAMLIRLFTAPMSAADFILGYMLPLFPMAIVQSIVCFGTAMLLGLEPSVNIVFAILLLLPSAFFFIGLGVLCGTLLSEKAVGGLCGALLTNLTAFASGAWFDLSLVGSAFRKICELLPFAHSVYIGRNALSGNFAEIFPDMYYVLGYMLAAMIFAVIAFMRKMKEA